jgi:hypothetical protein
MIAAKPLTRETPSCGLHYPQYQLLFFSQKRERKEGGERERKKEGGEELKQPEV